MKALVYTAPFEMTLMEQRDPVAARGESVVRVEAVGICGSDMHAYQGHDPRRAPPLVLGHEVCGRVQEGAHAGRKAILNPLIACGECGYCLTGRSNLCPRRTMIGMTRPGGYADAVSIPERCVIVVPDDMDPVHAALTEPAATGLHGLVLAGKALARPLCETRALIIGAGSVGLLTALQLRHQGCAEIAISERNPLRRTPAREAGFERIYAADADGFAEETGAFDLVADCVGARATRELAMRAVAPGGVVLHLGLMDNDGGLDSRRMTLSEITVIGAYTYTRTDLEAAAHKLHSGACGSLDWVMQRPLDAGARTFRELLAGEIAAPKVVLIP